VARVEREKNKDNAEPQSSLRSPPRKAASTRETRKRKRKRTPPTDQLGGGMNVAFDF